MCGGEGRGCPVWFYWMTSCKLSSSTLASQTELANSSCVRFKSRLSLISYAIRLCYALIFGSIWMIHIQFLVAAFHSVTTITLWAFTLYTHTHNVMKRRYSFHENSCLALSKKKRETNKNNPQLLGRVIFIYVAGSIQVPFDWQKPTNNRNIYRTNGGPQSLIWLKWNPKMLLLLQKHVVHLKLWTLPLLFSSVF